MTMTVKLDPALEMQLRDRCAVLGRPASEVIRQALQEFLGQPREAGATAFSLGADLFGRHRGPADLAVKRKQAAADVWAGKHAAPRK